MANVRALGISFIWAAQTRPQLSAIFGDQEARTLLGLTNNLILLGAPRTWRSTKETFDLPGPVRVSRTGWQTGQMGGRTTTAEDIPILTGAEVRQLKERHALVVSQNGKPMIARLARCIAGRAGRTLLAQQEQARALLGRGRHATAVSAEDRRTAALVEAGRRGLSNDIT